MKLSDFEKLIKFMQMTLSGSETEVAFALKKANEIVAASNTNWERILRRTVKVELEIESRDEVEKPKDLVAEAKEIDDAFAAIEASDPRGDFADFVASVKSQWDARRRLSPSQRDAILRSARRIDSERGARFQN